MIAATNFFWKIIYAKRSPLPGSISHVESFTASVNVGFTVKNTTQEPIDFLATTKPYVGSYPLFTGKSQLKNGLEVKSSLIFVKSSLIFVRKNVFDVCIVLAKRKHSPR